MPDIIRADVDSNGITPKSEGPNDLGKQSGLPLHRRHTGVQSLSLERR
jgi:hypothetical protein